jgi:beta-glucosidase
MPGPPAKRKIDAVKAALKGGEIDELAIDRSAKRVLELLELTGKFERPEIDPEQAVDLPEHRALIRQIGAEAIVLLKNSENILPLSPKRVKSIAALGFAKECLAYGGGSAVVNCHYRVTPLQALEARLGEDYDLRYSLGAHTFRVLPDMSVEMADSKGNPGFTVYLHKSKDPASDPFEIYNVPNSNILPFGKGSQLVVLEGTYQPTVSGNHYLSFNGLGPCKLFIDGKVILEITSNCPDSMAFFLGGAEEQVCQYRFEQGRSYMIRVESYAPTEDDPDNLAMINGMPGIRLGFMTQGLYEEDLLQDAVKTAASVECAIIFVGRTSAWETEGKLSCPTYIHSYWVALN